MTSTAVPDPFALLAAPPPTATEAEAVGIARRLYGLEAEASGLASERDGNFRMRTGEGRHYVLKIANAAEDPAVTNLQTEALRHIAARAPGLPVPRICATRDGLFEAAVTLAAGTRHVVRLLTFLPGEPLHRTASSRAQSAALGRCLAAIGLALRDFDHPAAAHALAWDLQRAPMLRPILARMTDPDRRAKAARMLDRYEADIRPRLAGVRRQVVHNDLNPHNVLVDPSEPTLVTGVFDFGDMVLTPLVNDVAVAAAYQAEGQDALGRVCALVAGYHALRPLSADEIDGLFGLIAVRYVMTLAIAEWRAILQPENRDYIRRHVPRAAAALDHFDAIGPTRGREALQRACGGE